MATRREGLAAARPRCQFLSAVACGCQLVSLFGISSGNETCSVSVCRLQNEKVITEIHPKEPRGGWKESAFEMCMGEGRDQSIFGPGLVQGSPTTEAAGSRSGGSKVWERCPGQCWLLGWTRSSVGLSWVHRHGLGPATALPTGGEGQSPAHAAARGAALGAPGTALLKELPAS